MPSETSFQTLRFKGQYESGCGSFEEGLPKGYTSATRITY